GARGAIRKDTAIPAVLIERHEGSAILALFFMEVTGALALVGLWRRDRLFKAQPWSSSLAAILFFSVLTAGLMARVGAIGGDIHHPEIRVGQDVSAETGLSAIVRAFEDALPLAKFFAASSLVLWFAVIALGRYIQSYTDTIPVQ